MWSNSIPIFLLFSLASISTCSLTTWQSWCQYWMTPNTHLPSIQQSEPNKGGPSAWLRLQSWRCTTGCGEILIMGNWLSTTCTALCDYLGVWLTVCSSFQLALLSVSCCDSRGIQGPPSKQAIWSVTCKGDIFVSEPTKELEASLYPTPCDQM